MFNSSSAAPALYPAATTWLSTSIAMLVSLALHTAVLMVLALVTLSSWRMEEPLSGATAATEVAIGQIAVEHLSQRPDERLDENSLEGASGPSEQLDASVEFFAEIRGPIAAEFAVDELASPLASGGGSQRSALGDVGAAPAVGRGPMDGQATFMGVQGQGQRFCIVADRSGSMFGEKFEFLKQEILRTVAEMSPHARLQLVLFNERALPYPKSEWMHPGRQRLAIETWLRGVVADGDTYPTPAMVHAFALEPPPDTIFFMTDGQFDPRVLYQIRRLQNEAPRKVEIHTITFMDHSSEGVMRTIAAESGGSYRHVSGIADAR